MLEVHGRRTETCDRQSRPLNPDYRGAAVDQLVSVSPMYLRELWGQLGDGLVNMGQRNLLARPFGHQLVKAKTAELILGVHVAHVGAKLNTHPAERLRIGGDLVLDPVVIEAFSLTAEGVVHQNKLLVVTESAVAADLLLAADILTERLVGGAGNFGALVPVTRADLVGMALEQGTLGATWGARVVVVALGDCPAARSDTPGARLLRLQQQMAKFLGLLPVLLLVVEPVGEEVDNAARGKRAQRGTVAVQPGP